MSREPTRMVLVDPLSRSVEESMAADLPRWLDPRDLLVVNDAATLPASLMARSEAGEAVEIRLLEGPSQPLTWAVLFGEGDYRTPTELRAPPPLLSPGSVLRSGQLSLSVVRVSSLSPRLVALHWPGSLEQRLAGLYEHGRAIQYSYVKEPIALWDVQTSFAARPWAVEMPSAARPLHSEVLLTLRRRGVRIASVTHAAGLSATGDIALDEALPLPERYEIPSRTAELIQETKQKGGRVVAVGTSVVRALEDSAHEHGRVQAGGAIAQLVLSAETPRRVVDGLLTGIHVPGESHYRLLQAFVDAETLLTSVRFAEARGYRAHEFGDAALFLPHLTRRARVAA